MDQGRQLYEVSRTTDNLLLHAARGWTFFQDFCTRIAPLPAQIKSYIVWRPVLKFFKWFEVSLDKNSTNLQLCVRIKSVFNSRE